MTILASSILLETIQERIKRLKQEARKLVARDQDEKIRKADLVLEEGAQMVCMMSEGVGIDHTG